MNANTPGDAPGSRRPAGGGPRGGRPDPDAFRMNTDGQPWRPGRERGFQSLEDPARGISKGWNRTGGGSS